MLRLRPYLEKDTAEILSWCKDAQSFYQWTAGVLGEYPIGRQEFEKVRSLIAFSVLEEKQVVGFFTMRNPTEDMEELRIGFVILRPDLRGRGYGKAMLRLAVRYARELYGASRVTLGVFENNPAALHCYQAAGFRLIETEATETYQIMGETWKVIQMELQENGSS